ncbi:S8 family serine peptidase [Bacillus sp. CGMCC 1.16607]|uniref:S8 family serine peptidase n=1 Tax=Bacillus sp. CGMCC 1.16607 TaxID=3351842 RepID=UPI00362A4E87
MKKKNQKWFLLWIILLLLFSIIAPSAIANQVNNEVPIDTKQLEVYKDRLLKYRNDFKNRKIDSSININSNETVKVIVEFNEEPSAVKQHKANKQNQAYQATEHKEKLKQERILFKANLAKNAVEVKEGKSFEKVLNGMALEVKASDVPKLAADPNVKFVYENSKLNVIPTLPAQKNVPYMEESSQFIGTDQLWDLGYEGQGKKIGVLDTGIDYNHPDLKDAYKGGYDFVDNDGDPFEGNDGTQSIDSTHGTHVSGTIAGRGSYENGGIRGIAPKSDLYVYRVLGPNGGWDEWVIAGIEKAVEDNMDVINLSLGNGINDPDHPTSRAVNNAMLAGVVAVVANGNDGTFGYKSVGAPATAALAISVGASSPPIKESIYKANASATSEDQKEYTLNWMMKRDPDPNMMETFMNEQEIVYLGFGTVSDFEGKDLTGKIALIKMGGLY